MRLDVGCALQGALGTAAHHAAERGESQPGSTASGGGEPWSDMPVPRARPGVYTCARRHGREMGTAKRAIVPGGAFAKPRYPNMLKERASRITTYHR